MVYVGWDVKKGPFYGQCMYVQLDKYYTFNFYPIGVILVGMNNGFSAIAIPDIMAEYTRSLTENTTASYLTPIQADMEQLSWFGRFSYPYFYFQLYTILYLC